MSDGKPLGMIVGSFTSVSLDPPLVAFLPDRKSRSWSKIEATGGFCVNVLSEQQEYVCKALASKLEDKFETISYRLSQAGLPILDKVLAWIDCDLFAVHGKRQLKTALPSYCCPVYYGVIWHTSL
jgi:3-hydroxy-9,10-secoandrosta-1,3,5(10)-triene-9,17-dione monooxygenase reductase component